MPTTRLDTDYLILGAGAMGLAFADVILSEHPTARLVVVLTTSAPWTVSWPPAGCSFSR